MASKFQTNDLEKLFLMEFMIMSIHYSYSSMNLDKDFLANLGQTCVRIKFKNYPLMEICEEDFEPGRSKPESAEVTFRSGKSCLFSLRQQRGEFEPECLDVCITVLRRTKKDGEQDFFKIGTAKINLTSSFTNLFQMKCDNPSCRAIKDTYNIKNNRNECVGTMTLFVRLSSFGKMITTQFQLSGPENSSFLFKGVNNSRQTSRMLDESRYDESFADGPMQPFNPAMAQGGFNQMPPYGTGFDPMQSSPMGQGMMPYSDQMGNFNMSPMGMGYNYNDPMSYDPCWGQLQQQMYMPSGATQGNFNVGMNPSEQMGVVSYPDSPAVVRPTGKQPTQGGMRDELILDPNALYQNEPPAEHGPDPCCYEDLSGDYKELEAEINGYALKIKVLRRQKKSDA